MSREVHFIIAVNLDDENIRIDDDSFIARYSSSEQVWDTETSAWRRIKDEEYELALNLLNTKKLEED